MNFYTIFNLFALLAMCLAQKRADDDKPTTTSQTSVYVTVTVNGKATVVQTVYSQTFISTYESATGAVPSGAVGMGSLSGSVGGVRSYSQTTVGQANAAAGLWRPENMYAGAFGFAFLLIGGLL
ncbi:uncharacterized protein CANTADRAFT_5306 [Suhomyces tanzawaensis NRRL Y-17324]|uniref:Uncharacterized protein n=1 Tax=Suhomyces tanzawaensis NRRL Y-17324 TaxID=984487 RepID=A0A1E4SJ92_9ASCO|nr:uncharacterized protein CANTADRAFT_5306 [Suhomyces tanzawaensis NRRL Y-17324]ODV79571.1 hypothetical protein CANTADRAFT_5306 [Suhomyces tanzawaensis NRRL Y-17324]